MIFVISASSSIEIDIRERNSREKVFSNPWGDPRHQKSKSKISKFQPYRKTQKGSLINIKTTVTVNFREMKNAKTANPLRLGGVKWSIWTLTSRRLIQTGLQLLCRNTGFLKR